jgi:hypothetical protein
MRVIPKVNTAVVSIGHALALPNIFGRVKVGLSPLAFLAAQTPTFQKELKQRLNPSCILYQLYLLNSPKLFNKFTMVNADTT